MGALGGLPLFCYVQNCEIKNTGFIHCFWPLRSVLTGILFVHTQTQLEPGRLDYDLFSDRRDQIRMYSGPSKNSMM